jgi:uncharacterized protein (TIGR02646 family)
MIKKRLPAEPKGLRTARASELAKFESYYKQLRSRKKPRTPPKEPEFAAYKTVKQKLNQIYAYKCAYCETYYDASQPVAIEHYRPKGTIVEDGKRFEPGYYWLAAVWSNLTPSCTDCNSRRSHRDQRKYGKGMLFPLTRQRSRPPTPGCERNEKALLLNPWRDRPEHHLDFSLAGKCRGLVRGKTREGETTIKILGLNRPGLVTLRRELVLLFDERVEQLVKWQVELARRPRDKSVRKNYEAALDAIKDFADPPPPRRYLQMRKQLVASYLRQLTQKPKKKTS